jgi:formate dehydrogenase assembly factor FdhD
LQKKYTGDSRFDHLALARGHAVLVVRSQQKFRKSVKIAPLRNENIVLLATCSRFLFREIPLRIVLVSNEAALAWPLRLPAAFSWFAVGTSLIAGFITIHLRR